MGDVGSKNKLKNKLLKKQIERNKKTKDPDAVKADSLKKIKLEDKNQNKENKKLQNEHNPEVKRSSFVPEQIKVQEQENLGDSEVIKNYPDALNEKVQKNISTENEINDNV